MLRIRHSLETVAFNFKKSIDQIISKLNPTLTRARFYRPYLLVNLLLPRNTTCINYSSECLLKDSVKEKYETYLKLIYKQIFIGCKKTITDPGFQFLILMLAAIQKGLSGKNR